jgi:WD40 repeat protein
MAATEATEKRHSESHVELHACQASTGQTLPSLLLPIHGTVAALIRVAERERQEQGKCEVVALHILSGGCFPDPSTPLAALRLGNGATVEFVLARPHAVLTVAMDGTVKVFDADTGVCMLTLPGCQEASSSKTISASFSPDGRRRVVLPRPGGPVAKIVQVATGECLVALSAKTLSNEFGNPAEGGHTERLNAAAFSPEGYHVATASADGTAKVWNASTGECLQTLAGHKGEVLSVAFAPDGRGLVTTSDDTTAKIWCLTTFGGCLGTLRGHKWAVNAASFSPDGHCVVTASDDRTVKVWDAHSWQCLQTLVGHTSPPTQAIFSSCWKSSEVAAHVMPEEAEGGEGS